MKYAVIPALLLVIAGCGPSYRKQEETMVKLAREGGYKVGSVPKYEDRWKVKVRAEGCTAIILLTGDHLPKVNSPNFYEVHSVAGIPFHELDPKMSPRNLPAASLKKIPAAAEELNCQDA